MSSCALYEAKVAELFSSLHRQDVTLFRQEMNQIDRYLKLWELEVRYSSTKESMTLLNQSKKRYTDVYNDLVWAERSAIPVSSAPSIVIHAEEIQKEDLRSLDRTLASINDSKEVAIETGIQLKAQTDQLAAMADDVDETEGILSSSIRTIGQMAKRVGSDKVVWVFAFLVLVAVIVVIAL